MRKYHVNVVGFSFVGYPFIWKTEHLVNMAVNCFWFIYKGEEM